MILAGYKVHDPTERSKRNNPDDMVFENEFGNPYEDIPVF